MGLLAPLLLGGLAFLAVPWLIHRKRKPPRNPTPFSSLMFVPEGPPTTRARKQIEDPWLMALRMLLLAILALAFARPYQLALATYGAEEATATYHVILADVSTSMNAGDLLAARNEALETLLDSIGADDRVAVVAFDARAQVLMPFALDGESNRGSRERARRVLADLPVPAGGTDYGVAIARAESLLRSIEDTDDGDIRRVIHLVSDLQRSGWPSTEGAPSLSEHVELDVVALASPAPENVAVEEVALVPNRSTGTLLVRARLRNYGPTPVSTSGAFLIDGALVEEQPFTVPALGSRTIAHRVDLGLDAPHRVSVRTGEGDGLAEDDARYAAYTPEALRRIAVFGAAPDGLSTAHQSFLEAAIADSQPLPWSMVTLASSDLEGEALVEAAYDVLIVVGSNVSESAAALLGDYISGGGRALLIPGEGGFSPSLSDVFLTPNAITMGERRFEEISGATYATFAWLDFEHPVFQNFRDPAYSDFSMVRFQNFFKMTVGEGDETRVLARLEGESVGTEYPALLSAPLGAGHLLVWAFPLDGAWTNLMRTRRFVPLVHESIEVLLTEVPPARSWHTGDAAVPARDSDGTRVSFLGTGEAGSLSLDEASVALSRLTAPGFIQWEGTDGESDVEAVNLVASESDLACFTEEEFRLRLGMDLPRDGDGASETGQVAQDVVHWEHGYTILALLLGAYVMEAGLALWLGRKRSEEA